ncbi:HNH endonuclease family protein [Clostridioides difficile CD160]|nr:HNH endonuclease family protein [Clostridioides difficile CD160]
MSNIKSELQQEDINNELKEVLSVVKYKSQKELKTININNIVTSEYKKISRSNTIMGLTSVVSNMGILNPIIVISLEDKDDNGNEQYLLLEGLRRIYASMRNELDEISAIVLRFDNEDIEKVLEIASILSAILNRSEKHTAKELWEQINLIEEANDITPALIEYLYQLQSGEVMKIKDIMLSEYKEIKDNLLNGDLSIEKAYNKLKSERKKENKLNKEEKLNKEDTSSFNSNLIDDKEDKNLLSADKVREVLDLKNEDIEDKDLDELNKSKKIRENIVQDVNNREIMDKNIKTAIFMRDDFTCQCCGRGGKRWLGILVGHHIVPVYLGGNDTEENGLTLCSNCHIILHDYLFGNVPNDMNNLSKEEQQIFKNIFKYGNIALKAQEIVGMDRKTMKKNDSYNKYPYPGKNLKINQEIYTKAHDLE